MTRPDFATLQRVVDAGGFSRAAERLETTPGAVRRRIAELERLFCSVPADLERRGRPSIPTDLRAVTTACTTRQRACV